LKTSVYFFFKSGYNLFMKIYSCGGAVRDELMGNPASDFDYVVVGATEKEMLDAGYKPAGAFFPVFLHPTTGDEYALARKEKKSGVGHTAFTVEFDKDVTLAEDLARRDLTINAMAKDLETGEIVDPFRGQRDLKHKILRHTSVAFAEDPLRVVRLARFYARFEDFYVADETTRVSQKVVASGEMDTLSEERFWAEMNKMFRTCRKPDRFFAALWNFYALTEVKFFKDLFGPVQTMEDLARIEEVAELAAHAHPDFRLTAFVAAAGKFVCDIKGTSVEMMKLHKAMQAVRNLDDETSGLDMLVFLQSIGAVSKPSKTLENLVKLLTLDRVTLCSRMSVGELTSVCEAAHSVKSDEPMFAGLEGIALGYAMNKERVKRIDEVLK
jgi:tRNA nucleotidyltransferase/poly(A) polymerase